MPKDETKAAIHFSRVNKNELKLHSPPPPPTTATMSLAPYPNLIMVMHAYIGRIADDLLLIFGDAMQSAIIEMQIK